MRVRHSKGLALVGACILFAMSLAACGNSDTAADAANTEIGRASCRERVCQYV